jgi:hypothetical protein
MNKINNEYDKDNNIKNTNNSINYKYKVLNTTPVTLLKVNLNTL